MEQSDRTGQYSRDPAEQVLHFAQLAKNVGLQGGKWRRKPVQ